MIPFVHYTDKHNPPSQAAMLSSCTLESEPVSVLHATSCFCWRCWNLWPPEFLRGAKLSWIYDDGVERQSNTILCPDCMDVCADAMIRNGDYWRLVWTIELLRAQHDEYQTKQLQRLRQVQQQPEQWQRPSRPARPQRQVQPGYSYRPFAMAAD